MARLSELVKGTARASKIKEETVALCARHLREAGLISKKGRGTSAADMTARDAVNLLLALMAAPEIKDAAECVKRVSQSTFMGVAKGTDVEKVGLPNIPWLWHGGKKPTQRGENMLLPLGDVLENILASDFMLPYPEIGEDVPMFNFFLTIDRPGTHTELHISDGSRHWWMHYSPNANLTKAQLKQLKRQLVEGQGQGMVTITRISANELFAISDIIKGEK